MTGVVPLGKLISGVVALLSTTTVRGLKFVKKLGSAKTRTAQLPGRMLVIV